mmetsp:Transcript_130676/g.194693  ORF Transcript_130676/g.194693 Transcript_130676/m.194693 type:complete len:110 (+) Transcript_130676:143-472(+)
MSRPPLHVLRAILRCLKVKSEVAGENSTSSATRKYIMEQYRASESLSLEAAEPLRNMADDYLSLQKDIAERARLHKLDTGVENQLSPKEMSRRAAARAGLQLPDLGEQL